MSKSGILPHTLQDIVQNSPQYFFPYTTFTGYHKVNYSNNVLIKDVSNITLVGEEVLQCSKRRKFSQNVHQNCSLCFYNYYPNSISRFTEVKLVPCMRLHPHSDPCTQVMSKTTFNIQDHSKPCFTVALWNKDLDWLPLGFHKRLHTHQLIRAHFLNTQWAVPASSFPFNVGEFQLNCIELLMEHFRLLLWCQREKLLLLILVAPRKTQPLLSG